jgi:hypothetical protein
VRMTSVVAHKRMGCTALSCVVLPACVVLLPDCVILCSTQARRF